MADDLELEQEFERYKNAHMISICMSALVYDLELEVQKGLHIPTFLLQDKIEFAAKQEIVNAVKNNTIQDLYYKSWNRIDELNPTLLRS